MRHRGALEVTLVMPIKSLCREFSCKTAEHAVVVVEKMLPIITLCVIVGNASYTELSHNIEEFSRKAAEQCGFTLKILRRSL